MDAVSRSPGEGQSLRRFFRQVWPLLLGNVLEWYEFGVYGFLEVQLKTIFFHDSALGTWLGFAVTFMMRPLGGIANGLLADRVGRRTAVLISLIGMMLATAGQGMLPSQRCCGDKAGTVGLVLLLIFRAMQGVSAGGELGAIVAYFSESAPKDRLCSGTGLLAMTAVVGFLVASTVVALLVEWLGPEAMLEWGWRLPFLVVLLPGLISLWGRTNLQETDEFMHAGERHFNKSMIGSVWLLFHDHARAVLIGFAGTVGVGVAFYSGVWCTSYLKTQGLSQQVTLGVSCMQMATTALGFILFPLGNDRRWGWDPIYWVALGSSLLSLSGVFVFWALSFAGDQLLLVAIIMLGLVWGFVVGCAGSHMYLFTADLFPTHLRALGFGLSFNLSFAYLGGSAALVDVAMAKALPSFGPGLYWSLTGFFSLLALLWGCRLRAQGKLPRHLTGTPEAGQKGKVQRAAVNDLEEQKEGSEDTRDPDERDQEQTRQMSDDTSA